MLQIILILLGIGLLVQMVKWLSKTIFIVLKVLLSVIGIVAYVYFASVTIPLTLLYVAFMIVKKIYQEIKLSQKRKKMRKWILSNNVSYTEKEFDVMVFPYIENVIASDQNDCENIYSDGFLPYGRINAFLNYFEKNIYEDQPYYFSSLCSKDDNEIREYGVVITRTGIYIAKQEKNTSGVLESRTEYISFSGMLSISQSGTNTLIITGVNKATYDTFQKTVVVPPKTVRVSDLKKLCDKIISSSANIALFRNQVVDQKSKEIEHFELEQVNQLVELAGLVGNMEVLETLQGETKNYLNAAQKGGYAAEYANNTIDRLSGNKVEVAAQILDQNGHQVKAGADRIVNGVEIQTKYYSTPSQTIGAAFDKKEAIYITSDGTERMMQIEVPRDQYPQALKLMQSRIDSGQVSGVSPGVSAENYVRKGYFTYAQAWNVARAGSIESLTVDLAAGSICSSMAGGISSAIVFAIAVWNGETVEAAAKMSLQVGIKIIGKGALIYALNKQLTRAEIAHPFIKKSMGNGIYQGQLGAENPILKLSEQLAANINTSAIANTGMGNKLGLKMVNGKMLIANVVTSAVVFGPDLCKTLQGKISFSQLMKNSAVGATTIAAASVGQALIPIPYVGAMIGAGIGGGIAKNILDNFIEDDAKKMFRILKEEFLDVVMMSQLTSQELNRITEQTVGNKDVVKMLQNMYSYKDHRYYAREIVLNQSVLEVLAARQKITVRMSQNGLESIASAIT